MIFFTLDTCPPLMSLENGRINYTMAANADGRYVVWTGVVYNCNFGYLISTLFVILQDVGFHNGHLPAINVIFICKELVFYEQPPSKKEVNACINIGEESSCRWSTGI